MLTNLLAAAARGAAREADDATLNAGRNMMRMSVGWGRGKGRSAWKSSKRPLQDFRAARSEPRALRGVIPAG